MSDETLGPVEAGMLLRMAPSTVKRKAAAGEIPGAKPGREWVFIKDDLLAHIRNKYKCSTKGMALLTGGHGSTSGAARLTALLAPESAPLPKNLKSSSDIHSGDRPRSRSRRTMSGKTPVLHGLKKTGTNGP